MGTRVVVVSDLHLGGPEGFQMCSQAGAKLLGSFIDHVSAERTAAPGREIQLVVAGDFVDFLAEPDDEEALRDQWRWSAFCADEGLALSKLERILRRTSAVWDALQRFVRSGGLLAILLGNHDVELSLPRVRRRLIERIAPDGGRVSFLYDGEAFSHGKLLVEHGNRYEGWNVVDHDALRELRSGLSRREHLPAFNAQPGSTLVADVMNAIKRRYAFVDLLKPETGGVIPILAVLDPALWRRAGKAITTAARAAWRQSQFGRDGKPTRREFVAAPEHTAAAPRGAELIGAVSPLTAATAADAQPFPDEDAFAFADQAVAGTGDERIGAPALRVELLLEAFRMRRKKDRDEFAVESESDLYTRPAGSIAADGFDVVVFGHTHHAKRVDLKGGKTYLNTGTWADLMCVPETVYADDRDAALAALTSFLDDVKNNRIERYRSQVATFAQIDLDDHGEVQSRDVFFFDDGGVSGPISTQGVFERLAGPAK